MALRFGPKQAIDAFLPPLSEDAGDSLPDPREPPHPMAKEPVEAALNARPVKGPFNHVAPGRPAEH